MFSIQSILLAVSTCFLSVPLSVPPLAAGLAHLIAFFAAWHIDSLMYHTRAASSLSLSLSLPLFPSPSLCLCLCHFLWLSRHSAAKHLCLRLMSCYSLFSLPSSLCLTPYCPPAHTTFNFLQVFLLSCCCRRCLMCV